MLSLFFYWLLRQVGVASLLCCSSLRSKGIEQANLGLYSFRNNKV
jgi:hypothetical protein